MPPTEFSHTHPATVWLSPVSTAGPANCPKLVFVPEKPMAGLLPRTVQPAPCRVAVRLFPELSAAFVPEPSLSDQNAPGERATFALVAMCWLPTLSDTTYRYM